MWISGAAYGHRGSVLEKLRFWCACAQIECLHVSFQITTKRMVTNILYIIQFLIFSSKSRFPAKKFYNINYGKRLAHWWENYFRIMGHSNTIPYLGSWAHTRTHSAPYFFHGPPKSKELLECQITSPFRSTMKSTFPYQLFSFLLHLSRLDSDAARRVVDRNVIIPHNGH